MSFRTHAQDVNVETQNQDKGVNDSNGNFEVSYEDYGDFEGSYEDYGVIPEGYGESFEDPVDGKKSAHAALLDDQTRTKNFAKHNWIKVVREYNGTETKHVVRTDTSKMEESQEVKHEDSNIGQSASSIRGVKMEKNAKKEKEAAKRVSRRKNFVETRWPSESELKVEEDDSNSAALAEEVLVSLIIN